MKVNIEVFINKVSIKIYPFLITDTLVDVRKKLNMENSEDYIFLINDSEIKNNDEKQYTIKDFEKERKIYIKKKIKTNPFLSKMKKNPVNDKKKEANQNNNNKIDNKPINNQKEKSENQNIKNKINEKDKTVEKNNKKDEEKTNIKSKKEDEVIKGKNAGKPNEKQKESQQKSKKEQIPKNEISTPIKDQKKEIKEENKITENLKEQQNTKNNEVKNEELKNEIIETPKEQIKEEKEKKQKQNNEILKDIDEIIQTPKEEIKNLEDKESKITNKETKKNKENKEEKRPEEPKKEQNVQKDNKFEPNDETSDITENVYDTEDISYEAIDNNIEQNVGIESLVKEFKDKKTKKDCVQIRKELLRTVNSFIACLGPPGSGKSSFCSNYYKKIFNVKNNFFEPSDEVESFTKGIWIVSEKERRKIPIAIKKDILDVEGFQAEQAKCWQYVMIIAFLSTELLILNRDARFDSVKKVMTIISKSLEKMKNLKIPRILKTIYIQTVKKNPMYTVEELLGKFNINKNIFNSIKLEYVYLPNISEEQLEECNHEIMEHPNYKKYLNQLLSKITKIKNYNSVASLTNYIDSFNEAVNGNSGFDKQAILKDLELDFNGVYNRHESRLKNELFEKKTSLKKLERLDETFEEFIEKQEELNFEFTIDDIEYTFYGTCDDFDNVYNNLKGKKSFKVSPKEIFLDVYNTQMTELIIQDEKRRQEEEQRRLEEERKQREEEERKRREEEDRKREEERKQREEEERKKREEEDRKREEERQRREEMRRKEEERIKKENEERLKKLKEEERKRREEEQRRLTEERRRKEEEERIRYEEEQKRLAEERRKREEEERKRYEEEQRRIAEERKRKEEEERKRREEEDRKREEQRRKREEEERKRLEEEQRRIAEERKKREEEERKRREEEDRKREEERKIHEEKEKILKMFIDKKRDIDNYFAGLKFKEQIKLEFKLEYDNKHSDFFNEQKEKLSTYLSEKVAEKKKEWDEQIERAKWKTTVQAHGEMRCKNGHEFGEDACNCMKCHGPVYWADSDENFVICKNCENNGLARISGKIVCGVKGCGADCLCKVKWIRGYKP